jgi:acetyltransferase-like isoleucine patch superfamily enzyme
MASMQNKELKAIGFKTIGQNVSISKKASFHNPENIGIGDNVRIDDFCILSAGDGGITIGNYVHIACYASLIGRGSIILKDFAGISGRVSIYSGNDDYSGNFLTGPTVKEEYRNVTVGEVIIGKHAVVGAGSVILPKVRVGTGAIIGALSLVKKDCRAFGIYAGCPAKFIKKRSRSFQKLEKQFLHSQK